MSTVALYAQMTGRIPQGDIAHTEVYQFREPQTGLEEQLQDRSVTTLLLPEEY